MECATESVATSHNHMYITSELSRSLARCVHHNLKFSFCCISIRMQGTKLGYIGLCYSQVIPIVYNLHAGVACYIWNVKYYISRFYCMYICYFSICYYSNMV